MRQTRGSTLSTLIQHNLGITSQSNKTGWKNKGIAIGKEIIKLFFFADNIILFLKDPENSTKNY
jgi:hypothetical protein